MKEHRSIEPCQIRIEAAGFVLGVYSLFDFVELILETLADFADWVRQYFHMEILSGHLEHC